MLDTMIDENGVFTEEFTNGLPEMLGDNFFNDPDTKQQPTKIFDNIPDLKTLVNSHANGSRAISRGEAEFAKKTEGMVRIPTDKSTEDEVKAYRKAIGVPDSESGYEMAIPAGDDADSFNGIAQAVRAVALAAGAPTGLVSKIWDKVVETMQGQFKALEDKGIELMKADDDAMKAEHKENYPQFIKGTDDALAKFKTGADIKSLFDKYGINNNPIIRKLLAEIAPLVNEGKTVFGGPATGSEKDAGGFPTYEYDENGKVIA